MAKGKSYKPLKAVFHQAQGGHARGADNAAVAAELERRLTSSSTIRWPYRVGSDQLFVHLTAQLQALVERIWRNELGIGKLWGSLPRIAQRNYLFTLLVEELYSTNEIEGIHSTRHDIEDAVNAALHAATATNAHTADVQRFREMARAYLLIFGVRGRTAEAGAELEQFPERIEDMRALYDRLLAGTVDAADVPDGKVFRAGPVTIWDGSGQVHRGVDGEEEIESRMQIMLDAQGDAADNVLVQALAGHFMLEHTHPFYDGNGRFGRYLLVMRLYSLLSAPTAISLSAEILRQKSKYYKAFRDVEQPLNRGEATFFVHTMAALLADAQHLLIDTLQDKTRLLESLEEKIALLRTVERATALGVQSEPGEAGGSFSERECLVLRQLGMQHLFGPRSGVTQNDINGALGLSYGAVRPVTRALEERGLVTALGKSPLVFSLTAAGVDVLGINETAPAHEY